MFIILLIIFIASLVILLAFSKLAAEAIGDK